MKFLFILQNLFFVLVSYLILVYSNHIFANFSDWASLKNSKISPLMGSQDFKNQRQSVSQQSLHLGAWHGFNDVSWQANIHWSQLKLNFKLNENSYLWVLFPNQEKSKQGFRISFNEKFLSGFFTLDQNDFITEKENFTLKLQPNSWNSLEVSIANSEIKLLINGKTFFKKNYKMQSSSEIYFRNGAAPVELSNFMLLDDTQVLKAENFLPAYKISYFLISLFLTFLFDIALYFLLSQKNLSHTLLLGQAYAFLFFLAALLYFDVYFWSAAYHYKTTTPFENKNSNEVLTQIEQLRKNVFSFFSTSASNSLIFYPEIRFIDSDSSIHYFSNEKDLAIKNSSQKFKIAFMGSSQTSSSGARAEGEDFVSLSLKKLNVLKKNKISAVNFSMVGKKSNDLKEKYFKIIPYWKPQLLVINLSNNDNSTEELSKNLTEVIKFNQSQNIQTVLIKEANSIERQALHLDEKHQVLETLAHEYHLPIFDLNAFITSTDVYDSGRIWWDPVHFAPTGHHLVGEWLAQQLQTVIP